MAYPTTIDDFTNVVDNVDDVMAIDINELQDAIEFIETKLGVNGSVVAASIDYKVNSFFVTGRKMWLYENTAPTGWTIVGISDITLAVKGGTGLYNVAGGNVAGETWVNLKAHVHTGPSHVHAKGTLAGPNHTHTLASQATPANYDTGGPAIAIVAGYLTAPSAGATSISQPSATTGNPSVTALMGDMAADGTGNTGAQSTVDVRPTAAVGIIVTKN